MSAQIRAVEIDVNSEVVAGTMLAPKADMPGILFVHGWGGNRQRDLHRAERMAGLGCQCLTFDLRGHERTKQQREIVSRADNLHDVLAAYDFLAGQPSIDATNIGVIGTSYGGYLSALLTTHRPVRWLALRAPALYQDEEWCLPKVALDRAALMRYRNTRLTANENLALKACSGFYGDVLIVESETDDFVPHQTICNYRISFENASSMTHRIIRGADHALSLEKSQKSYSAILHEWIAEMVIGARVQPAG
ncbi:MAG: alpha/beta fold hydrolase [Pseudohongiella sp.]|nr:alpha/beta fold hydrolase [Pseudohongiella sp.]